MRTSIWQAGAAAWTILGVVFLAFGERTNCLVCIAAAQPWIVMTHGDAKPKDGG